MALYQVRSGDPEDVTVWEASLNKEALATFYGNKFASRGTDSIIQIGDSLKIAGGTVKTFLRVDDDTAPGVTTGEKQTGNESQFSLGLFSLNIEELSHAYACETEMTDQRAHHDAQEESRDALARWWAIRYENWMFNQLCGNTVETDTKFTGMNAAVAPSANRHLWVEGTAAHTDDSGVSGDSTAILGPDDIDIAINKAQVASPMIRPVRVNGEDWYVLFIHPNTYRLMRQSSGDWVNNMRNAMSGGRIDDNPIFRGGAGIHNNCVIHVSKYVTDGAITTTAYSNVKRNVLCGAQALRLEFGRRYGPNRFKWVEKYDDYEREFGVSARTIGGMKATRFDDTSEDFGKIVVSSYAPDP